MNNVLSNFRLHPQSKSINDGNLFEDEYDRLRLSLFEVLHAPQLLKMQVEKMLPPLYCKWEINIPRPELVLAEFATVYAEKHWVKDEWEVTSALMQLVIKWKGLHMSKKETKLWMSSNVIPRPVLMRLKKIKKTINFS